MTVVGEFLAPGAAYPLGTHLDAYPDVSLEVERVVPLRGSTHYVWITGDGREDFLEAVHADESVDEFSVVDELPDRLLVRFEWERRDAPLLRVAEQVGVTPVSVRWSDDGWAIRLRFADQDQLAAFYEASEERGVPLELRQTHEPDGDGGPGYGLTGTQAETLLEAFESGYFDVPRRITLAELAADFGVSEQAVSERLRRGSSSLLRSTAVDGGSNGDEDGQE